MSKARAVCAGLFALILPGTVHGFPENIRHGYVNCTACHVSPSGGGALTVYGRELSRELMSTWGVEGEQKWFYVVDQPERTALGGDLRAAYLYQDNTKLRQGRWYFMQADVEAYFNALAPVGDGTKSSQALWVGGSLGVEQKNPDADRYSFISRRHWINWRPTDEISLRAGKFQAQFGLNVPDHIAFFRNLTGRGQGSETYNFEAAWIGDKWSSQATAIFGRPDDSTIASAEKGFSASTGYAFWDRNRLGVSVYQGLTDSSSRVLAGPFAMLSFTDKLFLLSEVDGQWLTKQGGAEQRGFVTYSKLGYEAAKGVIPYVLHEIAYLNDQNVSARTDGIGAGLQWMPRPHLEANLVWEKQRTPSAAEGYVDYAYLMLHFYP